jgi:small-conductance mechanosensitive channel
VRAGVGYLGFGLAAIAAVSYAGFDFSNLAIVAGALSLGLGFGMQSIVNNFVSGLILLAERPIKVGDWIVVGDDEGIVKDINVRATIIETFDRSNLIIPNSQLISQTVKNWTLKNNTGRIQIPVGVHYDSDADLVVAVLLEVAQNNEQVLSEPEPFVYFNDFADSSLNFTLYAYTVNVRRRLRVATELRLAILKAFREKGIEIPYPQTDVHMRDISWIKQAIISRMTQNIEESSTVMPDSEEHSHPTAKSASTSHHNAPRESDSDDDGGGDGNGV